MELRPHPDVAWRRLGDDVVIVQLHTNKIYSLNHTAARAWELLSEGADLGEVERTLLDEFDVEATELSRSLEELLEGLSAAELLVG